MPEFVGRLRTPRLSTAPSSPIVGEMYYDTGTNELKHWNGTAWIAGGAGGADLVYNGDYPANTPYTDGDVVIHNGVIYMCVRPTSSAPSGWSVQSALSYATTLPSSPVNGQEAILVDSVTTPTYQWRFRYNANSTSTYKWEFVGGSPVFSGVDALFNTTSGSYVSSGGPSFTCPRAGIYIAAFGARAYHQNLTGAQAMVGLFNSGVLTLDIDSYQGSVGTSATLHAVHQARERDLTAVASGLLEVQYRQNNGGTASFSGRWLRVTPVRVS